MYDNVITLIKKKISVNSIGDRVEETEKREVFANVKSIGMKESYEAFAVGLKPECTFVLADYFDYEGEKDIEYNGRSFSVLRTYQKIGSVELELVVSADVNT